MILLSSTLKNAPPPPSQETTVSISFFPRNWDGHNQNSQLKKFEKICRQLLSTMNFLNIESSFALKENKAPIKLNCTD